ncbi:EpsG family protein [Idiomarina sp. M1R2S28]|uniref:EpsG family protein n=1 Tax=Idiomarina rhizosphaerae TaxID=2961572 RepID=A0A9X2FSZ7_9GAMM|nr:EpsG family protein [Idiomarina rhizosphaerae]MCP1338546.1 EpsG family protein [Idiomarina rhizosphaerae]
MLACGSLLEASTKDRYLKFYLPLCAVFFMSLLAGLRTVNVGADYSSYEEIFYNFTGIAEHGIQKILAFNYFFEPGFAVYIVLFKTFFNSSEGFFFLTALINCVVFYFAAKRLTPLVLTAFLVYFSYLFFTHALTAVRYGIASSIGLHVLYQLSVSRHKKALFYTFLAMTMHTASIVLFAPFLYKLLNLGKRTLVFGFFLSFIMGAVGLGRSIVKLILPDWLPRADSALNYVDSGQYGDSLGFLGMVNLKNALLCLLIFYFWRKCKNKFQHFKWLAIFFVLGTCLRLAFHDLGFIIGRMSAFLTLTEVILFPMLMFTIFRWKVLSWVSVCLYALLNLIMLLHIRGFTPYESILF